MELVSIRTDTKEAIGRLGLGRVVRDKKQGAVSDQ